MPESKPVATAATPSSGNGKSVYEAYCTACHQADGKGLPGAFPPLANADYFLADTRRAIAIVLAGKSGPITVNGVGYDALMPPFDYLSDEDIAAALTYALNAWGNAGGTVTAAQVAAVRNAD